MTDKVQELDPQGTNTLLRQMVVIGHSQGGLLTKSTAVDAGDRIWRVFSTNRLEDLKIPEADREKLRRALFLEPLPFVKRVVFIATPHRGSYLSSGFARRLAARLVSLPGNLVSRSKDVFQVAAGSDIGKFLRGRMPTSLDGMSPKNPGLLAMAEIPVVPGVKAHSIIPVLERGRPSEGQGRRSGLQKRACGLRGIGVDRPELPYLPGSARHHRGSPAHPAPTSQRNSRPIHSTSDFPEAPSWPPVAK